MELIFLCLIFPFFIYWCVNEKIGLQLGIVILLIIWTLFLYRDLFTVNLDSGSFFANINFNWIIAALIFCGYIFLRKKIEWLLSKGGIRAYLITACAVSFLMILYKPGLEFIISAGMMFGLCVGYCLSKRFIGFKSAEVMQKKGLAKYFILLARFIIGISVLAVIIYRIEKIMEHVAERQNIMLYCFVCYAVICFWVTVAAPWLFIKLRLAGAVFEEKWTRKNDK